MRVDVEQLTLGGLIRDRSPVQNKTAMTATLDEIGSRFSEEDRPDLAPLVNWSGAGRLPIHRWFRYREAFSPRLIEALKLEGRILDPFCGSGSIVVGAAELGRVATGIDVNPLATFIAKVKLTPLTQEEIQRAEVFLDGFQSQLMVSQERWPVPQLRIADKVFEPEILDEIMALRALIECYAEQEKLHSFLLLGWISILQDVGSYFKEGNGIKYRNKKRTKSGYVKRVEGDWQRERFGDDQRAFVRRCYATQLRMMINDTSSWKGGNWRQQTIIQGDAVHARRILGRTEFDSIVFSPPYANRFDYFESMKVELWFGGFVNSYDSMTALRKQSLRSHLGADLQRSSISIPELESLLNLMDKDSSSWRMNVPSALRGYFDDMYHVLVNCRQLIPKGQCHIVVGNSAYAGVIIPTDNLIAQLGLMAGFNSARIQSVRHLTVSPQQRQELGGLQSYMRESVVVLE